MRTNLLKTLPIASAAALALGAAIPALADAPAAAAPTPLVSYSGLFDGYWAFQFNNPKDTNLITAGGATRYYDTRHNTPTLALGELNAWHTAAPGGLGFKVTLGAGDIAEINGFGGAAGGSSTTKPSFGGASSTHEGQFKSLMQAYGTYAGKSGWGIDFGKFYTPIGYEVTESNGNMNETHSVPFATIPFYHTGIRAYTPSMKGLVLTGYVVQAVYNTATAGVENDAKTASFVGSAFWTDPKGKWVIGDSFGFGKNKFNLTLAGTDPTKNKITVNDTDITYNFDPTNIGGLDYTYAQTKPDNNSDSFKATDNSWAAYYKHILNPTSDVAVRYSGGEFKNDAPGFNKIKPWEATITYEKHPATNFLYRVEYQHSGANQDFFLDKDSLTTKKSQDVLEVAGIFSFSG